MKNIKILVPFFAIFMLMGQIAYGQNVKMQERARAQVEKLNDQIVSGNPNAGLTQEQQEKILNSYMEKFRKIRKLRTSEMDDEQKEAKIKGLHKETAQIINMEILTKEQRQAKRKAKQQE